MPGEYDDSDFDADSMLEYFSNILSDTTRGDEPLHRAIINRSFVTAYIHMRKTLIALDTGNIYNFTGKSADYSKIEKFLKEDFQTSTGPAIAGLFGKLRKDRRKADYHHPRNPRTRIHKGRASSSLKTSRKIVELSENL